MTRSEAIKTKWKKAPKLDANLMSVKRLLRGGRCLLCDSTLLLPIIRHLLWKVHCNHCGSEYSFGVLLNQKAWRICAKMIENPPKR